MFVVFFVFNVTYMTQKPFRDSLSVPFGADPMIDTLSSSTKDQGYLPYHHRYLQ